MSFEIAPVNISPVAAAGAAGFSSIDGWQDYDYKKMETTEDIGKILKEARGNNEDMKNIYLQIMVKIHDYIKDKVLQKYHFLRGMEIGKTMDKFNFFAAPLRKKECNISDPTFKDYFNELIKLYDQIKNKERTLSLGTKRNCLAALNSFYKWLNQNQIISQSSRI